MREAGDYACRSREAVASLLQTIARNDAYTRQQILDSKVCGFIQASNIKDIRQYDSVKMPIATDDSVIRISVSWVKMQTISSEEWHDAFMADNFLKCK